MDPVLVCTCDFAGPLLSSTANESRESFDESQESGGQYDLDW